MFVNNDGGSHHYILHCPDPPTAEGRLGIVDRETVASGGLGRSDSPSGEGRTSTSSESFAEEQKFEYG